LFVKNKQTQTRWISTVCYLFFANSLLDWKRHIRIIAIYII